MDITIQNRRSQALERDGRYYKVFTPRSPDEVVKLHHMGCVGDTVARNIQIEQGSSPSSFASPVTTSRALTGLFKDMRDINIELTDPNSSLWGKIRVNNRGLISEYMDKDVKSALAQTSSSILAQVEARDKGNVKRAELILDNNGFVTKVGKTVNGRTLATMIAQNERDVAVIAEKMKVTGDMLVDGAITARKLDTNSVRTGILTAGSITADMIQAGAITGDKLKVDAALIDRLATNDALVTNLIAKKAFITAVQAVDLSASRIKSGVLSARNGVTQFDLETGTLEFYTDSPALRRIQKGYPNQFIRFATGFSENSNSNVGVTVIGSNRGGTESSDDGGFVGIRAWNGPKDDILDLVGDTIHFASSPYKERDGWTMSTTGKLMLRPYRAQDRRDSVLVVGDVWLCLEQSGKTQVSLHETLRKMANSIGALYDYREKEGEGHPAWWDVRDTVGRLN
ncbi:gp58-like family protein [Streptococcus sp. ZJ93]|uniref:gp58-like family protein n=1 Tax=Streptococcus handemini TaxID=3161188 RepID=UPI0034D5AE56